MWYKNVKDTIQKEFPRRPPNLECDLDAVKGGLMAEYVYFQGIAHPINSRKIYFKMREILWHLQISQPLVSILFESHANSGYSVDHQIYR